MFLLFSFLSLPRLCFSIAQFLPCTGRDLVDAGHPSVGNPRLWVSWNQSLLSLIQFKFGFLRGVSPCLDLRHLLTFRYFETVVGAARDRAFGVTRAKSCFLELSKAFAVDKGGMFWTCYGQSRKHLGTSIMLAAIADCHC